MKYKYFVLKQREIGVEKDTENKPTVEFSIEEALNHNWGYLKQHNETNSDFIDRVMLSTMAFGLKEGIEFLKEFKSEVTDCKSLEHSIEICIDYLMDIFKDDYPETNYDTCGGSDEGAIQ